MSRILSALFLMVAGMAGIGLVTSCNIIGGGGSGATGTLNLLVTDDPTDDWQQVLVVLKSISLHHSNSNSWEPVWTPDPNNSAATTINLVELAGVTAILETAKIPEGTYDRLKLVIDTDPTTGMKLVTDDGAEIAPSDIKVVDPSGKGEIKVDLSSPITVQAGETTNLAIDFDLAHPLSIVNLDGKVVINLKVRHKLLPRHLNQIQFARTIGNITEAVANADGTGTFKIHTLQEADITFKVNGDTIYVDADHPGQGANFEGLKALVGTGAALVASNMNADGSFYARRVWYAAKIETLPQFTPEGLVRRVGDTWLSILGKRTEAQPTGDFHHHCDWHAETVFVNSETQWFFQGTDMGIKGPEGLRYISRGFRVEVTYVPSDVYPKEAESINIQHAHREGLVASVEDDKSFTLGWYRYTKTMFYSDVENRAFGWWFYGDDANRNTDIASFKAIVNQARQAHLWVFAWAGLCWDSSDPADKHWEVENLVLAPMKLHDFTKIQTGFVPDDVGGTIVVSTYDCWDSATPATMTIQLDKTGDLQTVVGSFVWNSETNLVTFTLPVSPDKWGELLTPTVNKVKIWVRPVKVNDVYSWYAYSVIAYQFIR